MSRKARANARLRKGSRSRTAPGTAAPVRHATPATSLQSAPSANRSSAAPARAAPANSPQESPSSQPPASAASSTMQVTYDSALQVTLLATSGTTSAGPAPAVVTVAAVSTARHGGINWRDMAAHLSQAVALALARLHLTDDLARQRTVARTVVARYLRSRWFVAEVVGIAGLFAVCFGTSFDAAYFYRISGLALGIFAVIATYMLAHEVASARFYLLRSLRALGRISIAPLVVAATITRIVAFMLLLSLVLVFRRLAPIEPLALLAGAVGLLANCALIATITVACSTPYAPRGTQLGVLVWVVAALATYSPGTIVSSIPVVSWLLRLPLLPFATCYNFGVIGAIGWPGVAALVAEAALIVATIAFVDLGLKRRRGGHKRSEAAH